MFNGQYPTGVPQVDGFGEEDKTFAGILFRGKKNTLINDGVHSITYTPPLFALNGAPKVCALPLIVQPVLPLIK